MSTVESHIKSKNISAAGTGTEGNGITKDVALSNNLSRYDMDFEKESDSIAMEKMLEDLQNNSIEVIQVYLRSKNLGKFDILVVIDELDYSNYDKITYAYDSTNDLYDQSLNSENNLDVAFMPKTKYFDSEQIVYDGYKLAYEGKRQEITPKHSPSPRTSA